MTAREGVISKFPATSIINDRLNTTSEKKCSQIESLSVSGVEETGVTSFVTEACSRVIARDDTVSTRRLPVEGSIQDLTDYFSRPVGLTEGVLPLDTRASIYTTDFTNTTPFTQFTNGLVRLSGVYGVRATIVITLQVAASPFHQGVLALAWQYGDSIQNRTFFRSASHVVTNLPHVRLDIASDTMVQLRVPFLSDVEYMNLSLGTQPSYWGSLILTTLLPTPTVAGITAPPYQMYIHLEDMEFFGSAPLSVSAVTLQMGPITKEFEDESRPYSSGVMALSRVAHFVGQGIPALSALSSPTSWFLEKVAGTIRHFGYARPQVVDPVMRMQRIDNVGEQNVDVASAVQVIGPMSTNSVRQGPEFAGTDVDEMAFSYITKVPSQIQYFVMNTSTAGRTVLYVTQISPSVFWYRNAGTLPACNIPPRLVAPASTGGFQPSSIFALSQMFKLWRGTFHFRFTFCKTKMHGGRVMIVYNPEVGYSPLTSSAGTIPTINVAAYGVNGPNPYGHSSIHNLRDASIVEFAVPYTSPYPYMPFGGNTGSLAVYLIDPIQAPAVVSQGVTVMVEVSAGADYELADFVTPVYPPSPSAAVTFQGGLSQAPDELSEYTVGESLASVKQLISIPHVTPISTVPGTGSWYIPHWTYSPTYAASGVATCLNGSFSVPAYVATWFAFAKGGTDLHANMTAADSTSSAYFRVTQFSGNITTTTQSPSQAPYSNNCAVQAFSGSLHARLPAYSHLVRFAASAFQNVTAIGTSWGFTSTNIPALRPNRPVSTYKLFAKYTTGVMILTMSAADDASLAMFMGPTPLLLLSTNAVTTLYDIDSNTALI
jgi:hypothetical protein